MTDLNDGISDDERELWLSFLVVSTRLYDRIDHELQQRSRLSITDFQILDSLASAPERRLRMSDLADRVLVSRSRLTYRVDRLTGLDLVTRQECEDDRRGLFAILTDSGAKTLAEAEPGHLRDIRRCFLSAIEPDETDLVRQILARMDDVLDNR